MAAMALAPAHHFPAPPQLKDVPAWLRLYYVNYLFGRPSLFLHAGEAERYAAHGARAMGEVCRAIFEERLPDSLAIARLVARVDSAMIYFNEQSLKSFFRGKARTTEWLMLTQEHLLGHGFPLARRKRPRIGILHRSLAPGTETYHLLGYLVGRDRNSAEVRGLPPRTDGIEPQGHVRGVDRRARAVARRRQRRGRLHARRRSGPLFHCQQHRLGPDDRNGDCSPPARTRAGRERRLALFGRFFELGPVPHQRSERPGAERAGRLPGAAGLFARGGRRVRVRARSRPADDPMFARELWALARTRSCSSRAPTTTS